MSYEVSAAQWHRTEGFVPGRLGRVCVTAKDNRNSVNCVMWMRRGGDQ